MAPSSAPCPGEEEPGASRGQATPPHPTVDRKCPQGQQVCAQVPQAVSFVTVTADPPGGGRRPGCDGD